MPLTRIALRAGKPAEYRKALTDGIQRSLEDTFNVPKNDMFMLITEHEASNLIYDRQYLNIERSDDFVAIQLTVSNTRTIDQKKALYRRIVDELAKSPGLRREDVFISLVEVEKENCRSVMGLPNMRFDAATDVMAGKLHASRMSRRRRGSASL